MMKKWMALTLAMALVVSSVPVGFAATAFSDMAQDRWSYAAVKSVSEKNIMPGFGDASFKPGQTVSKIEVVVTSYRAMKIANKLGKFSAVDSVNKYKEVLSKNNIPAILSPYGSDVYTALGYAIENKIISVDDLKTYMISGKPASATKQEIATIQGKMLNMIKQTNVLNKIISFSYKDASEISNTAAPYVYFLIENKILSKTGDNNGKFGPKSTISREILATMLMPLYTAMGGSNTPVVVAPVVNRGTKTGVTEPTTVPNTAVPNTTKPTTVPSTTTPNTATVPTTVPGATTPSTTTPSTTPSTTTPVKPVDVTTTNTTTVSTDGSVIGTGIMTGKIALVHVDKQLIEVKDQLGKTAIFNIAAAQIFKDNTPIGLMNLEVGQNIVLSVMNAKVTKIVIEKNYAVTEGTFVELTRDVEDPKTKLKFHVLTVKKPDTKLEYFKVDGTVYVEIDKVAKTVDSLVKNDKITVSSDNLMYARKIEAYGVKSEFVGTLTTLTDFKAGSVIAVKMPDGRLFEQKLKADVEAIKMNNKDIKRMDIVKVITAYGDIKRIEATGLVAEDSGYIREILISDTSSKITILNKQGERKTYTFGAKYEIYNGKMKSVNGLYDLRVEQEITLEMDSLGVYSLVFGGNKAGEKEKDKLIVTVSELVQGTMMLKGFDESGKVWVVTYKEGLLAPTDLKIGDKALLTGVKLTEQNFMAEIIVKNN